MNVVMKRKATNAVIYIGASVFLIKDDPYKSLRLRAWLRNPDIMISQADGRCSQLVICGHESL